MVEEVKEKIEDLKKLKEAISSDKFTIGHGTVRSIGIGVAKRRAEHLAKEGAKKINPNNGFFIKIY